MLHRLLILAITCAVVSACSLFRPIYVNYHQEYVATSKNTNVCGLLKDSVVIYPIFVDVDQFHPWSPYDIDSTLDSIYKAMDWLEQKALENNRQLYISTHAHTTNGKRSFRESSIKPKNLHLDLSLLGEIDKKYGNHVENWANKIAIYASRGTEKPNDRKVGTRNKVSDVERLIARLRNQYETDNVALMFFVNGYYEKYPSASLHTYHNGPEIEYSIITDKNPAVIAHELLHLFGAIDLYPNSNHPTFNYKEIEETYPNELMRIQHKNLDALMLSPITKYYIGWQNNLDQMNTRLLYHTYNVVEY